MQGFIQQDPKFIETTGGSPALELLVERDYACAHEGVVFVPATNELFMTSNRLEDKEGTPYVSITKATIWGSASESSCEVIPWTGGYGEDTGASNSISMANSATNWEGEKILFCVQSHKAQPSGICAMSSAPPYTREKIVTDFYDRHFKSVNDVVVAQSDGTFWFTDPSYGFEQVFRPKPLLPDQVCSNIHKTAAFELSRMVLCIQTGCVSRRMSGSCTSRIPVVRMVMAR